jgi:hypothetical protein
VWYITLLGSNMKGRDFTRHAGFAFHTDEREFKLREVMNANTTSGGTRKVVFARLPCTLTIYFIGLLIAAFM